MDFSLIMFGIKYVIEAPYFWQSMGATTGLAMVIGVVLYDGHIQQARKGIVSVGSYAAMLLWVTILRVNDRITSSGNFIKLSPFNAGMAYAGIVTIGFLSLFWVVGIFFGVIISWLSARRVHQQSLDNSHK